MSAIPVEPTSGARETFAGQSSVPFTSYQWRTPGITHENQTELISLNVFHFPEDASYCWTSVDCERGVDETIINFSGSTFGSQNPAIDFRNRSDDLVCGNADNPSPCYRTWGINPNYRYELTLRAPSTFDYSYANGEAKNGTMRFGDVVNGSRTIKFSGEPVELSYNFNTPIKPLDPGQNFADVTYSTLNIYAQTVKSKNSQWLSQCNFGREMSFWYSGQLQSYPMWVAADSSLALQISSTHLKADESINQGVININMPIETARCLWGVDLSKAVSATISATYPELGISEIVTTSSKIDGNFFKVSAAGFHFSAPTIKLKIVSQVPTQKAAVPTKPIISIVCIKGKLTKKVSGVSPRCPAGFKKR